VARDHRWLARASVAVKCDEFRAENCDHITLRVATPGGGMLHASRRLAGRHNLAHDAVLAVGQLNVIADGESHRFGSLKFEFSEKDRLSPQFALLAATTSRLAARYSFRRSR
jgi:hypothetical protein